MEQAEDLKREEIESEKKKLLDIRNMRVETVEKIKRLEDEHKEQRILYQKKLRNLRNVLSHNDTRIGKLASDVKLFSNLTVSRRDELKNLVKINEDYLVELKKTKEDTETEVTNLKKKIEQLEAAIKQGYAELHNEKEIQVLMEVGLGNVKEDGPLPLSSLESILRKRQECVKQRQEEINKEVSQIEQEQAAVEMEIKQKQDKLVALKDTYLDLIRLYKKAKN